MRRLRPVISLATLLDPTSNAAKDAFVDPLGRTLFSAPNQAKR
jgi:hypothetical protein